MRQDGKISAGQLLMLAFLTRIIIMISVDSQLAGGKNLLDLSLSAVCYLGLNLVLILPAWMLHKRYPELDLLDAASYGLGKAGQITALLYAAYFLFMNSYFLTLFEQFMEEEVNPRLPVWLVSAAVLAVACYGAFLGLESIARTAGFLFLLACAGMLFLLVSLNSELRSENFTPLLYDGAGQTVQGTLLFLSRSTFYSVLPILLPRTTGSVRLKYLLWNVGLTLFFIVLIVTVCGTLGPMAGIKAFPVYTMSSLAQSGPFQRLDAVYIGIWMMGLFLTLALDLYLVCVCISHVFGKTAGRISILAGALALVVSTNTIFQTEAVQLSVFRLEFILIATLLTGLVIPCVILAAVRRKGKQHGQ